MAGMATPSRVLGTATAAAAARAGATSTCRCRARTPRHERRGRPHTGRPARCLSAPHSRAPRPSCVAARFRGRWAECVRAGGLMARMGARGRGGAIHLSTKIRIWRRVHECELQSLEATRNFACWASLQLIFRAASGGSWWGAHTVVVGSGAGSGGLSGAVTHAVVDARGHLQLLRPAVLHRTCGGRLTMRSYPHLSMNWGTWFPCQRGNFQSRSMSRESCGRAEPCPIQAKAGSWLHSTGAGALRAGWTRTVAAACFAGRLDHLARAAAARAVLREHELPLLRAHLPRGGEMHRTA